MQAECAGQQHTHAHLQQGTHPSKKALMPKLWYLNITTIAKGGLTFFKCKKSFLSSHEHIAVSQQVLDCLLTDLHIQLNHPSSHNLKAVTK